MWRWNREQMKYECDFVTFLLCAQNVYVLFALLSPGSVDWIELRRKTPSVEASLVLSIGILRGRAYSHFSVGCLKVGKTHSRVLPFGAWRRVSLTSRTRRGCVAEVCITSRANLFLLFIGKERTIMAAARGAKIRKEEKYCCSTNIDRATTRNLQMEILAHFLHFSGWDPLKTKSTFKDK